MPEHRTDRAPILRGLCRLAPGHLAWVCLRCADCREWGQASPELARAISDDYAAHRCGESPRKVPPGWGVAETPADCVCCGRPTYVRSERDRPCHPTCAARWIETHRRAPARSGRRVTA